MISSTKVDAHMPSFKQKLLRECRFIFLDISASFMSPKEEYFEISTSRITHPKRSSYYL